MSPSSSGADPFGAEETRARVLAGWAASPARFREDANAEEDQALGGYRDRLVVELAQNAADAAARAGVPGRLLLALSDAPEPTLVAANTGAPLDAAGVEGLATLRASAKRDDGTVGRYGVGFSAVLAVSDEPAVVSRGGGVRFSRADTKALVESIAGLADELHRRDGHVPALRLPFAAEGTPPDGYDTAVLLPLRDALAVDLVERLLDTVDDALLLALPGLTEVTVRRPGRPDVTVRDPHERWDVVRRSGTFTDDELADRPTEERRRPQWSLAWALPRDADLPFEQRVLHAPTPSDEPLPWRALLIATFPLDPSRRHVAPGAATDRLVREAASAYGELLAVRTREGRPVWDLVPLREFAGALDGALREAVLDVLPEVPVLTAAEPPHEPIRPRDAVALDLPAGADPDVVAALAGTFAGLVLTPRSSSQALRALGVRRMSLADAVEALPSVPEADFWAELYDALAPLAVDAVAREALAALPVPLADGRLVRGVRGVQVLPAEGSEDLREIALALAPLGLRVVDPVAASPLLVRLGAHEATARTLLESPPVRTAVEEIDDAEDPDALTDAVLALAAAAVATGRLEPGDLPWLGELPLPDVEGELSAASSLVVAGSVADGLFDRDAVGVVEPACVERWGQAALAAVGVLVEPAVLVATDVPLDLSLPVDEDDPADPAAVLPDFEDWTEFVLTAWVDETPPRAAELVAVRDLDVLAEEALPALVTWLSTDRRGRAALLDPVWLLGPGRRVPVPPYTAWWLRRDLGDGVVLDPEGDASLRGLLEPAPSWFGSVDPAVRTALGAVREVSALDAVALPSVLTALADPDRDVDAPTLLRVVRRLAELVRDGAELPPAAPSSVRVPDGDGTRVVPAADVVVSDSPMYRQRDDLGVALFVPPGLAPAVADLLDLALAADVAPGAVAGDGVVAPVPDEVRRLLPAAPAEWVEHDELLVDGEVVDWWIDGAGAVHAATTDGLARALAWSSARWELRAAVAQVLADPSSALDVSLDEAFS